MSENQRKTLPMLLALVLATTVASAALAVGQAETFRAKLLKEAVSEDRHVSALAMYNLGMSYLPVHGEKDTVRAYMWFTIAAAHDASQAFYPTTSRERLLSSMTPSQIESAEEMARGWMMEHWGQVPVGREEAGFDELQRRLAAGDKRALDEIVRRAQSGDRSAQIELGNMYWESVAVESDPQKALYWWRLAAEGGDVEIMTKLGVLYSNGHPGHGLAPDPSKGEHWLLKAGEQGHTGAAHLLAVLYHKGKGTVPADLDKYRHWYGKWAEAAAREGDFKVTSRLAGLYSGVIDSRLGECWPEDPVRAAALYQTAAANGDIHAQTRLGHLYLEGRGVEKNAARALHWFLQAAESNAPLVVTWAHLSVMYEQGIGTKKSDAQAAKWLERIMKQKDYTAGGLSQIGQLYREGKFLPPNPAQAAHYFQMAAVRGKPEAQFQLGRLYWHGMGVPHSPVEAYAWWILARDNLFDATMWPYPKVQTALKNAGRSMSPQQVSAARAKAGQLVEDHESLGIVEGKRMGDLLKKVGRD